MNRALAWSAAALASLVVACVGLPSLEGRTETTAFASTDATRLGRSVAPRVVANSCKSGIYALTLPGDAVAARALLANAAERSLDVQYYIWHADQTGFMLRPINFARASFRHYHCELPLRTTTANYHCGIAA